MDLLDNVATELGFEFHLYVVRDQLFGSKQSTVKEFVQKPRTSASTSERKSSKVDRDVSEDGDSHGKFSFEVGSP